MQSHVYLPIFTFDLLSMQRMKPISLLAILRGKSTNTVVFVIYHQSAHDAHTQAISFILDIPIASKQHREFGLNKPQQWWLKWIIWSDLRRYLSHSHIALCNENGRMESPKHMLHIMLVLASTGGQLLFPGTNQTSYAHNGARKYSQGREGFGLKIRTNINQVV